MTQHFRQDMPDQCKPIRVWMQPKDLYLVHNKIKPLAVLRLDGFNIITNDSGQMFIDWVLGLATDDDPSKSFAGTNVSKLTVLKNPFCEMRLHYPQEITSNVGDDFLLAAQFLFILNKGLYIDSVDSLARHRPDVLEKVKNRPVEQQ